MDYKYSIAYRFESLPDYWWVLIFGVSIFVFIIPRHCDSDRIKNSILDVAIADYLTFILIETLLNRTTGGNYELVPFWSYTAAINGATYLWKEIILNYLLFIPLGFFMEVRIKKSFRVWAIGVCLSLMIEVSQLIFKRGLFEFDDIIGNSLGCVIGAIIGVIILKLVQKKN